MEERQIQVLLEQAHAQSALGNPRGAIELVQRALAIDPDHARAHATLALALLDARRLAGAKIEMHAALALDGNDRYVHYAAAAVLRAARQLDDAWAHVLIALQEDGDAATHVLAARIQILRGDRARARELLGEALAIAATHTGALCALARLELQAGDLAAASAHALAALQASPTDADARAVAGHVELEKGDLAAAEGHARFVLQQRADHPAGLELWVAIKARRSPVLGAWWRFNSWLTRRDDTRRIAILIAAFVIARVLVIVTDELGYATLSRAIEVAWLALCAYTWIGPLLFRRMLQAELTTVKLDPSF